MTKVEKRMAKAEKKYHRAIARINGDSTLRKVGRKSYEIGIVTPSSAIVGVAAAAATAASAAIVGGVFGFHIGYTRTYSKMTGKPASWEFVQA